MIKTDKFELVSFDICPYVQRSVITLKHKKIDFKLTFIDLETPPEWFNRLSPLGKVPLLLVRKETSSEPVVLFESAVINEYLDEVTPPSLLPQDPLQRARERAWVAVSGEILLNFHTLLASPEPGEVAEAKADVWDILARVEDTLKEGNFFSGSSFSLVDAAFAPVFVRFLMFKSLRDDAHWRSLPKTLKWAKTLIALPEVQGSMIPEFKERHQDFLKEMGSSLADEIV